jgi:phage baseplate assembly protein V
MIDAVRREIERRFAQARFAFRAVSTALQLALRVQRAHVDGLAGEQVPDVELFQQFGHTSAPPDGSQLIVIPLGGRTSASVIVATEHGAYRFKLNAKGEAAMYNQWGDVVHMRQDRTIHMVAATQVLIDAPLLQVNGQIHSTGNITSDADVLDQGGTKSMRGMRDVYNPHTHSDPQGGAVGAPSGSM